MIELFLSPLINFWLRVVFLILIYIIASKANLRFFNLIIKEIVNNKTFAFRDPILHPKKSLTVLGFIWLFCWTLKMTCFGLIVILFYTRN